MRKRWKITVGFLLVLGVVVYATNHLIQNRLTRGDIYQPYSTFRADPIGAKALFDALAEMPGRQTTRFLRPLDEVEKLPPGTFFYLGDQDSTWERTLDKKLFDSLETWMKRGGRLVVTLEPVRHFGTWSEKRRKEQIRMEEELAKERREREEGTEEKTDKKKDANASDPVPDLHTQPKKEYVTLSDQWDVEVKRKNLPAGPEGVRSDFAHTETLQWDPLPWQSVQYFKTGKSSGWEPIASREGGLPVLIERKFGTGSLVLVSDTYLLSNEGLWKDRHPQFLSWLVGASEKIYFDEAHLGAIDNPGVASLARRYGVFGGVYMIALLLGLFAWRNASSLAPALPEPPVGSALGEESALGMMNLLKRSIPPKELLGVCLQEWQRTGGSRAKRHYEEVAAACASSERPLEVYRKIQQLLKVKRRGK